MCTFGIDELRQQGTKISLLWWNAENSPSPAFLFPAPASDSSRGQILVIFAACIRLSERVPFTVEVRGEENLQKLLSSALTITSKQKP
jgi:hypothetical protein